MFDQSPHKSTIQAAHENGLTAELHKRENVQDKVSHFGRFENKNSTSFECSLSKDSILKVVRVIHGRLMKLVEVNKCIR